MKDGGDNADTKKVIWTAVLLFSGAIGITYADIVYAEANINQNAAENNLIYNFKNTKKEGTITFTKKWKDRKNNDDRPIPDIEISTKKPKKNINGYTVTFHGNGMTVLEDFHFGLRFAPLIFRVTVLLTYTVAVFLFIFGAADTGIVDSERHNSIKNSAAILLIFFVFIF